MDDSTSPSLKGTPDPSSSPTPSLPDPTPSPAPGASPAPSSAGAKKTTARRKKTSRKKSTSRRSTKVDAGSPASRSRSRSPAPAPEPQAEVIKVTPAEVRTALRDAGDLLNTLTCEVLGVDQDQWPMLFAFDDQDLDELQDPVARIVNKRTALAKVVEKSDELVVTIKLGRWAADNIADVMAARRFAEAEQIAQEGRQRDTGEEPRKVVEVAAVGGVGSAPGAPEGDQQAGAVHP